jgi:UPF0716 protein FxsA
MPLALLVVVFLIVPIAELYVIYQVGDAIGVLWTFLLLAADSILGSVLLRSQGRAVWRRFNQELERGSMPHREVVDGVLVIFGGAFLITPGFLTDIVGLLLLLPPTRSLVRPVVMRRLGRRFVTTATRPRPSSQEYDVDGTATEHRSPPGRLGR